MARRRAATIDVDDPQPEGAGRIYSNEEYEARQRADTERARFQAASYRDRGRRIRARRRREVVRSIAAPLPRMETETPMLLAVLGVFVITAADQLSQGEVPRPRQFVAPWVVFLFLAFVAAWGPGAKRFANAFALLVLLATAVAHVNLFVALGRFFGASANQPAAPAAA